MGFMRPDGVLWFGAVRGRMCINQFPVQSFGQPSRFKNKFKDVKLQGGRARADVQPECDTQLRGTSPVPSAAFWATRVILSTKRQTLPREEP